MIEYLSGLPAYMAVVLFLAYLIWSKFLNKGQLRPDKEIYKEPVDAIIIVFVLFVILFSVFWYITVLLYILNNINDTSIQTNIPIFAFRGENFGWSIILLAVILILEFAPVVGKEKNRDNLKKHLMVLPLFVIINLFLLLGCLIGAYMTAHQYVNIFKTSISLLYFPLFVNLLILFSDYFSDLFGIKLIITNKNNFKKLFIFAIVLVIMGIAFLYTLPPKFETHDDIEHYSIDDEIFKYGLAKKEIKKAAYLKRDGYMLKLANINMKEFDSIKNIEFRYTDTNKYGIEENKEYTMRLDQKKENLKFLGIKDYIFNDAKNLVFYIDKTLFKQKNVSMIISGYKIENISDKFIINYTPLKQIKENHYEQDITFINRLDYPIQGGDASLLGHNKRIFGRNCNLTDAEGFIEGKNDEIYVDIRQDYSYLSIDFWDTRDFYLSIDRPYYNLDDLDVTRFEISNNTIVHLTFVYKCS